MTKLAKVTEFDNDVTEYKLMEKEVANDFLMGVIKLGEILLRQRDKWKIQGKWLDYLEVIGKHVSGANQFIRLYEYSRDNMKQLTDVNLSNWNKVNMFLALPDEVKSSLGKEIKGEDLPTDKFREKISKVDDLPKTPMVDECSLPASTDSLDFKELTISASMVDSFFMAKELLKAFKKEGKTFSNNCAPIAAAYIDLVKINNTFSKDGSLEKLDALEKKFWKKLVRTQIDLLEKLLSK